jgi:uncharacterized protein (DUF58 family)
MDIARTGALSTDFRELRRYIQGDPLRAINWKATARMWARREAPPLVNEYEREGKKGVWLFIDAAQYMEAGTSLDNSLERALVVANTLAHYFLENGYKVGACFYNQPGGLYYPETGRRQFLRLSRGFTRLTTTRARSFGLAEAVERSRRYIFGQHPLSIIITRLDAPLDPEFLRGLDKLRSLYGMRRYRLPITVVGINAYNLQRWRDRYDAASTTLLHWRTRPLVNRLRREGVTVMEWNPRRESFAAVLMRQVKGRWAY